MNEFITWVSAFGNSCWTWIVQNKDNIYAFMMSGQFLSLVAALFTIFKQFKQVKAHTASTNLLTTAMENNNDMKDSVTALDKNFKELKKENDGLRADLKKTEDKIVKLTNETINKLNAIIEVQSIVYTTIRDDGVRQTVNTILNNARYKEDNFKEALETKIEELKSNHETQLKDMNDRFTKSLSEVSGMLNATEQAKIEMKKKTESQRY